MKKEDLEITTELIISNVVKNLKKHVSGEFGACEFLKRVRKAIRKHLK